MTNNESCQSVRLEVGSHGGDYEDSCPLGCDTCSLVDTNVSEELTASTYSLKTNTNNVRLLLAENLVI
jgi:hypothetical protein